jgi:hypothetical protein
MNDYLFQCQYDDAMTGTRFTIELYKAVIIGDNITGGGMKPISPSIIKKRLPFGALSILEIDLSLHDTRVGLSADCSALISVDFNPVKHEDYYEDFQEAILFPQKRMRIEGLVESETKEGTIGEAVGTTWHIYEQHKLYGKDKFEDKRLIFTGQHIVGLEGEFNFNTNQITIKVENITSFMLKRINLLGLFKRYSMGFNGQYSMGVEAIADREYTTTQVFYHHVEPTGTTKRKSLIFSPHNIVPEKKWYVKDDGKNEIEKWINTNYSYNLGYGLIILWNFKDLLLYIDKEIRRVIALSIRLYNHSSWTEPNPNGLQTLFDFTFPLYKQKYDNSGELGEQVKDIYIIARIKSYTKGQDYYNICNADGILIRDGKYKYALNFIDDLLSNFCVFGNFTNTGLALSGLQQDHSDNSITNSIKINLDTDGVEYGLYFGLSKYSKLTLSNLEFYAEDVQEKVHETSYTETNDGMNIMTLFHNQPPNNKDGWWAFEYVGKVKTKGGTATSSNDQNNYIDWEYWGSKQKHQQGGIIDIYKKGNRMGEKFVLNLFYLEKDQTTTGRSFNDKYIVVHNGYVDKDGKGIKIEYYDARKYYESITDEGGIVKVIEIATEKLEASGLGIMGTKRVVEPAYSILEIKDKGCLHNTIADYINAAFNSDTEYPFCVMTLKLPVKELSKIGNNKGDIDDYSRLMNDFVDDLMNDKLHWDLRTKHKIRGKNVIKPNWICYKATYNISEGYFEFVLH